MTLIRSLFLVAATVAVAACTRELSLPESPADLEGTLTEHLMGPAYLGAPKSVLVEESLPEPQNRTIVQVETGTLVYIVGRGGRLATGHRDDLAVGDRLRVWTTGVELRSDPGQVTAVRVHILR